MDEAHKKSTSGSKNVHCPQYLYRIGDTYGNTVEKLILDSKINRAEKAVVSDRTKDDFQVFRPHQRNIDVVNERFRSGDAVYKHPLQPGYEGFVPRMSGNYGQYLSVQATEATSTLEREQMKDRRALQQIRKESKLYDDTYRPQTDDLHNDFKLVKNEFKLPLWEARPELRTILREYPVDEPCANPYRPGFNPYYKECLDKPKDRTPGRTSYQQHDAYRETAPAETTKPIIKEECLPEIVSFDMGPKSQLNEVYQREKGMLPNYRGHIPGAQFRVGKTYGNDTRDAKRWLRGDFSL